MSIIEGNTYNWRLPSPNPVAAKRFAEAAGIEPHLAHILMARGVDSVADAHSFLDPSFDQISTPCILQGVGEAVALIEKARSDGTKVLVYGDYDADGIAGTAILFRALQRFGVIDCCWDLPQRLEEGYGLHPDRVRAARDEGIGLIITVDNGSTAREACEAAQELGIDLIVTDHHQLGDQPSRPTVMINPMLETSDHPMAHACGAVVAFKLAWALLDEPNDLDLAALGTVADVMPLTDENRAIVAQGLKQMRDDPRPGIAALAHVAGLNLSELTAEQIAFQLAPRINAGGRMGDGKAGVALLLSDSMDSAKSWAKRLDDDNKERRRIEAEMVKQAEKSLEKAGNGERKSIVLGRPEWHPGVLGIVASRVQSRYRLPTVLVGFDENGVGRGSARSTDHVDLAQALAACKDHLIRFGGHKAAAGMTVAAESFEAFQERFEQEVTQMWPKEIVRPVLDIDMQATLTSVDNRLVRILDALEPVGAGNPPPLFACFGAYSPPLSRRILKDAHLRLDLRDAKDGATCHTAIGFGMADHLTMLDGAEFVDIVFTPKLNTWRGETTVQLQLKDIRPAS